MLGSGSYLAALRTPTLLSPLAHDGGTAVMKPWCIYALAMVLNCGAPALGQIFQGLGDLPGGDFHSYAQDVSGNGSVVVGYGLSTSGGEALKTTVI